MMIAKTGTLIEKAISQAVTFTKEKTSNLSKPPTSCPTGYTRKEK